MLGGKQLVDQVSTEGKKKDFKRSVGILSRFELK